MRLIEVFDKIDTLASVVILECDRCGNSFNRNRSEVAKKINNNNKRAFCSLDCYRKTISEESFVIISCDGCNKPFDMRKSEVSKRANKGGKRIFCSKECYYKTISNSVETKCANCATVITITPACFKHRNNFCCIKCKGEYRMRISIMKELALIFNI